MPLLSQQKFKYFRSLQQKKIRQSEGKFLVEGIKFCQEAFTANVKINAFIFCPQIVSPAVLTNFVRICDSKEIPYYEINRHILTVLSDTVHSQGVLCVIDRIEQQPDFRTMSFILAIDGAQDPGNVGTIIRTADWFGLDAILLAEDTVELYNPKVLRSTMGSIFHLPVLNNVKLSNQLIQLKRSGFKIYAADVHSDHDYKRIKFSDHKVLVIGNEIRGISHEITSISDVSIKISPKGKAESLNVAIATGIILSQMVDNDE